MGRPYQQFVRAYAERGEPLPCGVAVVTWRGGREHVACFVHPGPVYEAVVAGILAALRRLDRPGTTVEIASNNEAAVLCCTGARTPTAARSAFEAIRALLAERPATTVVFLPNRCEHPAMVRAEAIARQALTDARKARL